MTVQSTKKGKYSMANPCAVFGKVITVVMMGISAMTASCKDNKSFTTIDSKAWSDVESSLGWLSNSEVAFRGSENLVFKPGDSSSKTTVSVWKIGDSIRTHKSGVKRMCFVDKNLYYITENPLTKQTEHFFGSFGDEKALQAGKVYLPTCQAFPEGASADRQILPLIPSHGFLDRGPIKGPDSLKNTPVTFYKKGVAQRVVLPFGRREMEGGVRYFGFKNAYLITSEHFDPKTQVTSSPWPVELPRPLWWLTPEGVTSKFLVPAPWNKSAQFYPTTVGLVVAGNDARIEKPKNTDIGLFLIAPDGAVTKLADGYARNLAISPDGCRVAFSHAEEVPLVSTKVTLKVVQLCN